MEVSVIIPTYRPQEYIFKCLETLKNQTLNKNIFEVLIVLNGDKEPYYENIKKWILKNNLKNFKLFYSEIPGVSNARNLAINLSLGNYITFIDDDDYVDNNYLEELFLFNKEIGLNGIVVTYYICFEDGSNKILSEVKYLFKGNTLFKARKVFSGACVKMIPKSLISEIRFNPKYKNGEDTFFMLEISKNIKKVEKVRQKTLYWRRIRNNSAHFKKKNKKEIIKNYFLLIKDFSKLFFKREYNKKFIFFKILSAFKGIIIQFKN